MKKFLSATLLMVVLALGAFAGLALGDGGDGANDSKVTICHAVEGQGNTGSGYSVIDVSKDSIVNGNGQLDPNGHGTDPGDIIPAFDAGSGPGKTWGAFAGQGDASWISNGCAAPASSTTTVDTTPETTTTTESTTTPETTTTATTEPTTTEETTTTTPPATTNEQTTTDAGTPTTTRVETPPAPVQPGTAENGNGGGVVTTLPQTQPTTPAGVEPATTTEKPRVPRRHAPTAKGTAGLLAAATAPRRAPFTK